MNKNYDHCLEMLLEHEGGFVNHPEDPGGITNLGVTKKVYEEWVEREVSEQEMRDLTKEDVALIYKRNYWDRCKCNSLDSGVDFSIFDWAVNSGTGRAAKALQKIVGATADGAIGPATLSLVSNHGPENLIEEIYHQRQMFYESLNTFDTFGRGWTRRNKETKEASLEMMD
jgi:lysozyme family protein